MSCQSVGAARLIRLRRLRSSAHLPAAGEGRRGGECARREQGGGAGACVQGAGTPPSTQHCTPQDSSQAACRPRRREASAVSGIGDRLLRFLFLPGGGGGPGAAAVPDLHGAADGHGGGLRPPPLRGVRAADHELPCLPRGRHHATAGVLVNGALVPPVVACFVAFICSRLAAGRRARSAPIPATRERNAFCVLSEKKLRKGCARTFLWCAGRILLRRRVASLLSAAGSGWCSHHSQEDRETTARVATSPSMGAAESHGEPVLVACMLPVCTTPARGRSFCMSSR